MRRPRRIALGLRVDLASATRLSHQVSETSDSILPWLRSAVAPPARRYPSMRARYDHVINPPPQYSWVYVCKLQ